MTATAIMLGLTTVALIFAAVVGYGALKDAMADDIDAAVRDRVQELQTRTLQRHRVQRDLTEERAYKADKGDIPRPLEQKEEKDESGA
ncbi:MAG: hypothetical protein ACREMK_04180 [Gemmatimonadota bacterium]